jgi:NTE family protein
VRGLAHIGVIKVLQDEGIPVHGVCGTSAGSLIGAALAADLSWNEMDRIAKQTEWRDLVAPILPPRGGLLSAQRLETFVHDLVDGRRIEELPVPFCAVATDITAGRRVLFREGPVATAVRASCSIPGIFEPVRIGDRVLVDGGVVEHVPIFASREMGGDVVLSVNLTSDRQPQEPPESIVDILVYSFFTMMERTDGSGVGEGHVQLQPDLRGFGYRDLSQQDTLVRRGEQAARARISAIRELIRSG